MNVYEVYVATGPRRDTTVRFVVVAKDIRGVFNAMRKQGLNTDIRSVFYKDHVNAVQEER